MSQSTFLHSMKIDNLRTTTEPMTRIRRWRYVLRQFLRPEIQQLCRHRRTPPHATLQSRTPCRSGWVESRARSLKATKLANAPATRRSSNPSVSSRSPLSIHSPRLRRRGGVGRSCCIKGQSASSSAYTSRCSKIGADDGSARSAGSPGRRSHSSTVTRHSGFSPGVRRATISGAFSSPTQAASNMFRPNPRTCSSDVATVCQPRSVGMAGSPR
jgi:hypothetical protein